MENGPVEIVDFPMNSMVDLSIAILVHQRVLVVWIPNIFQAYIAYTYPH